MCLCSQKMLESAQVGNMRAVSFIVVDLIVDFYPMLLVRVQAFAGLIMTESQVFQGRSGQLPTHQQLVNLTLQGVIPPEDLGSL